MRACDTGREKGDTNLGGKLRRSVFRAKQVLRLLPLGVFDFLVIQKPHGRAPPEDPVAIVLQTRAGPSAYHTRSRKAGWPSRRGGFHVPRSSSRGFPAAPSVLTAQTCRAHRGRRARRSYSSSARGSVGSGSSSAAWVGWSRRGSGRGGGCGCAARGGSCPAPGCHCR